MKQTVFSSGPIEDDAVLRSLCASAHICRTFADARNQENFSVKLARCTTGSPFLVPINQLQQRINILSVAFAFNYERLWVHIYVIDPW